MRDFRRQIGFTNAQKVKQFFDAKDIRPVVDFTYVEALNSRLKQIVHKIWDILPRDARTESVDAVDAKIDAAYEIIKQNDIFPRLRNQGRRPEGVYFNWMRGYAISVLVRPALERIFSVAYGAISTTGADDLARPETFTRAPAADFELRDLKIRIEMQAGFQGANDIKKHKVEEAQRIYQVANTETWAVHFDFYNGKVAFVPLHLIDVGTTPWEARGQYEGQMVVPIAERYFLWRLAEPPPSIDFIKNILNESQT